MILIWQKDDNENDPMQQDQLIDEDMKNKENWRAIFTLRGHLQDVYDLSWSADSTQLLSGSTDKTVILWGISQGLLNQGSHINFFC